MEWDDRTKENGRDKVKCWERKARQEGSDQLRQEHPWTEEETKKSKTRKELTEERASNELNESEMRNAPNATT